MDPKRIVEAGYDRIGARYRPWSENAMPTDVRGEYLSEVLARLPGGAAVVELGCGPGADAVRLARGRRYVGVDLSRVQLAIARARVPDGTFLRADVTAVDFPRRSVDAVVSFFVFNHIPASRVERSGESIAGCGPEGSSVRPSGPPFTTTWSRRTGSASPCSSPRTAGAKTNASCAPPASTSNARRYGRSRRTMGR